ncbi:MAG TPA: CdaR family protein [Verrucomicrobiae bacterium]|nr:CdaR family protein [Verrucomicrobiae bacterium]
MARDWITNDWKWKLFSIALAVAVWLTVHNTRDETPAPTTAADSALTFENLPVLLVSGTTNAQDFHLAPAVVAVKVSGPPETIAKLQMNQIHAVVNLTNIETGKNSQLPVDISTPPYVTLVDVNPSEVTVIAPPKH